MTLSQPASATLSWLRLALILVAVPVYGFLLTTGRMDLTGVATLLAVVAGLGVTFVGHSRSVQLVLADRLRVRAPDGEHLVPWTSIARVERNREGLLIHREHAEPLRVPQGTSTQAEMARLGDELEAIRVRFARSTKPTQPDEIERLRALAATRTPEVP